MAKASGLGNGIDWNIEGEKFFGSAKLLFTAQATDHRDPFAECVGIPTDVGACGCFKY